MKYEVIIVYSDGSSREMQTSPAYSTWEDCLDHAILLKETNPYCEVIVQEYEEVVSRHYKRTSIF